MELIKKVIIVVAGMGSRMEHLTKDRPKCLVTVNGKPILNYQLEVLSSCGIEEVVLVRGYKKEMINYDGITYYENHDYERNNMLRSLFYAEPEMDEGFIFSFGDIIYKPWILHSLLENTSDIGVIVDTNWERTYEGRINHPISEANLVEAQNDNITKIGKNIIDPDKAHGEFIGLARFSRKGSQILREHYLRLSKHFKGSADQHFHTSEHFEKAYMDDMFQELINQGHSVNSINISEGWWEIDTKEDLNRVSKILKN
jgi:L-glutamine-phosphate cytidylyltransferase